MLLPTRSGRPVIVPASVALFVILLILSFFHEPIRQKAFGSSSRPDDYILKHDNAGANETLHLVLPATKGGVDLCKTILTGAILGYPTPTLIAWNSTFENEGGLLGGGSHVAKITGVLEWLNALAPSAENDLVLMMDAYDIWFQLPPEVMISRFHMINAKADKRLASRLGKAYDAENIRQKIIFAAGKRCAPNQFHTIACYPVPESPLPDDLYGTHTDTIIGWSRHTSLKQRYLNSGYIMGRAKDMKLLFQRAMEKVENRNDHDSWDNGSGQSDFMYHGSDQSIFSIIFGEQEYQREVMRRRHLSIKDKALGRGKPKTSQIEGTVITDLLNPDFIHEPGEWKIGKVDEFGIGLDYYSDLGQQTVNTHDEFKYLKYNEDLMDQIRDGPNHIFNCKPRVTGQLPQDILGIAPPLEDETSWEGLPLLTNFCLNTIPVMIHHNGDKGARAWQWPMTWMQPQARKMLEGVLNKTDNTGQLGQPTGGVYLPAGEHMTWQEMCPVDYEFELFRDVPEPEKPPPPMR